MSSTQLAEIIVILYSLEQFNNDAVRNQLLNIANTQENVTLESLHHNLIQVNNIVNNNVSRGGAKRKTQKLKKPTKTKRAHALGRKKRI